MTAAELNEKLRSGDKKALQWLFEQYYTQLVQYALKITSDPEASEEIVQDVFVAIWNNRKKSEINSYYHYLSRAVRNRCISYVQAAMKETEPLEEVMYPIEGGAESSDMEVEELAAALKEAEGILPHQTRLVFSLSRHTEMTYNEISQELSISVKTVEYHISKAFKIMRSFLATRGFELMLVLLITLLK